MSAQTVIDLILSGASDQEIATATLQQPRYDAYNVLRMISAARGGGSTIATVVSFNTIDSIDAVGGTPQNVAVTGTVVPGTTNVTWILVQAPGLTLQETVVTPSAGALSYTFTSVPVGNDYYVIATVPGDSNFVPVTSNHFSIFAVVTTAKAA